MVAPELRSKLDPRELKVKKEECHSLDAPAAAVSAGPESHISAQAPVLKPFKAANVNVTSNVAKVRDLCLFYRLLHSILLDPPLMRICLHFCIT